MNALEWLHSDQVRFVTSSVSFVPGTFASNSRGRQASVVTQPAPLPIVADTARASAFERRQLLQIFAFWTLMALLTAANGIMDPRGRGLQPLLRAAPVALAFVQCYLWAVVTPVIFWMCSRFTLERGNRVSRILLFAVAGIVVANLVSMLTDFMRFEVLYTPRLSPGGAPRFAPNFLTGVTRLWWIDDLIVFIAVLAVGFARDFFLRYQLRRDEATMLQTQAVRLQSQLVEARLAALRSQLNPHFLFNTLNAVSALVERDPKGVRRMIARLSELLRYSLEEGHDSEVILSRELAFLNRYLEIMQIRFQGRLDIVQQVDDDVRDALVPNLILQTLVENALKYGVNEHDGSGTLHISATRCDDQLVLSVRDFGPGLRAADISSNARDNARDNALGSTGGSSSALSDSGVGLRNTRARLEQLYGNDQHFSLRSADGGGVVAEVMLPFHTTADLHTAGELRLA